MFGPSSDGIPLMSTKDSITSAWGKHDEENQVKMRQPVRLLTKDMISSARKNSNMFHADNLFRACGTRFGGTQYVGNSFVRPSLPGVCYFPKRDSNLSPHFSAYPPRTHYSFPAKTEDLLGFMPTEHSATEDIFHGGKWQKKFESENGKQLENPHEFKDKQEKPKENRGASDGIDKIENYWERRRRNNASAKKSRDARRARELQTQIKVEFLEKENMRILAELMAVRQENMYLKTSLRRLSLNGS